LNFQKSFPNIPAIRSLHFEIAKDRFNLIGRASQNSNELLKIGFPCSRFFAKAGRVISTFGEVLPMPLLDALTFDKFHDGVLKKTTPAELFRCGSLRAITSLSLIECDPSFLNALVVSPASYSCPRLQELCVRGSCIDSATLVALVSSRTKGEISSTPGIDDRLCKVKLLKCTGVDHETKMSLQSLPVEVELEDYE